MPQVLLLESPHASADSVFAKYGIEVRRVPGALQGDELIEALNDVDMVGVRSKTNLTREVLGMNPHLTTIGVFCIGMNQTDVSTANEAGIAVFNAPHANTRSAVELAIAEAIALARHPTGKSNALQAGVWEKNASGVHEVRGRTLGIVGYGSIGTQLDIIVGVLGMSVFFYGVTERLATGNAVCMRSLSQLLEWVDIVLVHIDGRVSNAGFFGWGRVMAMEEGAILINLSRGSIVDLEVVRERLTDGSLSGTGIDMFPRGPNANGDPFSCSLAGLDNVILTPHIEGSTIEAQESTGSFVAEKLVSYWRKGLTGLSMNMPEVDASPAPSARHRVTWIHSNTPGALARVNSIFTAAYADIDVQTLVTSGEIGYMVTDLVFELPESALAELSELDQNIRLRVLHRD